MITLQLMLSVEVRCVGSYNALEGSYPEASSYTGIVSPALQASLVGLMKTRIRPSSISTVDTAWNNHWLPFCAQYDLDQFVANGDPNRAGIMASFILELANKGTLVFSTMQGYLWAVVSEHLSKGHASPLANVRDWKLFMHAVQVECHVPAEPRKMVPWLAFTTFFRSVDVDDYDQVVVACYLLVLFYTISRPEIIPKAHSGKHGWDDSKHLILTDFRNIKGYLEICLRGIKQDPLCKRKEAVCGKAWRAIGDAPKLFNLEFWLNLMVDMRYKLKISVEHNSPLFLMQDGRFLVYATAVRIMRNVMNSFLPVGESLTFSVGGVRVLAYNIFKSVCGDATARVQGMWGSDACELYDRADLKRILDVPSRMLSFSVDPHSIPKGQLENLSPIQSITHATAPGLIGTSSAPSALCAPLPSIYTVESSPKRTPVGWTRRVHEGPHLKRKYIDFIRDSDGKVAASIPSILRITPFTPSAKQALRTSKLR